MTDQEKIAYFCAHGWQARPCPMTMVPLFDAVRARVPDSYTDSQPELVERKKKSPTSGKEVRGISSLDFLQVFSEVGLFVQA